MPINLADLVINDGKVTADGNLSVAVAATEFDIAGVKGSYVGSIENAVTDNNTNYVYLDNAGALQINTTGFPVLAHARLAIVVTSGGVITSVVDKRAHTQGTSSATSDHDNLTNVTANQHHPQIHAIDGADHTGSLNHSTLSGVNADDHHPHLNKTELDLVTDGDHDIRTDNPHSVTTAQISATPTSRTITSGNGLTGGGDLSSDRTLNVVGNVDGSITVNADDIQVGILASDVQHGSRGGGTQHSEANGSTAGFMSAADKTKLDGVASGAQVNTVDSVFSRTGAVTAQSSDYNANQVDFTPNGDITATDVQAAVVEVRDDTDTKLAGKANSSHTHVEADITDLDHTDTDAIHNNVAGEIAAVTEKVTPVSADILLIEDSAAANAKKRIQIGNLPSGGGGGQTNTVTGSNGITNTGDNVDAILTPTYGSALNTVCQGNDARLSDARTPTSHATSHEPGGGDAMAVDAVAGTGSLRTLGTGASQACAGNDARLSDARTPTSHASSHQNGGSDEIATATPAANAIPKADATGDLDGGWLPYGTSANTACEGNDSRLSDARTPTSHASSHQNGGSDEVATATPAANAIPKAGAGSTLDAGWVPDGADSTAIHDDTAAEISAVTEKVSPVGADILLIEDSAAGYAKKKVQITNLPSGADADAIHDNVSGEINAIAEKVTPVSADLLVIEDSASSYAKKKIQVGNLPSGGGAPDEHIFMSGDMIGIDVTAGAAIPMDVTPYITSGYTLGTNEVTVNATATYELGYVVTFRISGNRLVGTLQTKIQRDSGGGYIDIANTLTKMSIDDDSNTDGQICIVSFVTCSSGDKLRIWAERTAGTGNLLTLGANTSFLKLRKLGTIAS